MTILITGATGFIGSALAQTLADRGARLRLVTRGKQVIGLPDSQVFNLGDMAKKNDWSEALTGVETVIHAAGIAHHRVFTADEYTKINFEAACHLATAAADAGVKHFIHISSAGVHGRVGDSVMLTESSPYAPYNDYSFSKQKAEEGLLKISSASLMALTIIRPPLVYASHAPGNFARLLKIVAQGMPLPLGAVNNERSIIALENLVDFIATCTVRSEARGQIFLIADRQPISTRQIVKWLAQGMKKSERLLSVPPRLVYGVAQLLGQQERFQQLCGNFILDSSKARHLLQWQAPLASEAGIVRAGEDFIRARNDPVRKI